MALHERVDQHELRLEGKDAERVTLVVCKTTHGSGHTRRMSRLRDLTARQFSAAPASALFNTK
jgi:hypothetical protein